MTGGACACRAGWRRSTWRGAPGRARGHARVRVGVGEHRRPAGTRHDPGGAVTATAHDLYDPDGYVAGPPHDVFTRLRAEQPVVWQDMPGEPGYWAVLRHADVVRVARRAGAVLGRDRWRRARGPAAREPGDDAGHAAGDGPAAPSLLPAQRVARVHAEGHGPSRDAHPRDLRSDPRRRAGPHARLRARRVRQAAVAGGRRAHGHPARGLAAHPPLVGDELGWSGPRHRRRLRGRRRDGRDDRDGDVRDRARGEAARPNRPTTSPRSSSAWRSTARR